MNIYQIGCLVLCLASATLFSSSPAAAETADGIKYQVDPVTRYIQVSYPVPVSAPDAVSVVCSWASHGKDDWHPASVIPMISETASVLAMPGIRTEWGRGIVTERRASGLQRTVVFNPYPEAQEKGRVDIDFRVEIRTSDGRNIASQVVHVQADNSDVVYLTDFSKVLQKDAVVSSPAEGKWLLTPDARGGNRLTCKDKIPVPALTYPLDLRGSYAVFVSTDPETGPVMLRLSGDERSERVTCSKYEKEIFWRWDEMDWEHLVMKQRHYFTGFTASSVNYVKLVPLTKELVKGLSAPFKGKHDKFVTAYYEPYSWAFYGDIRENYQHREPLSAFAETGVDLLDVSCGRFGCKSVYETRKFDQLIYKTEGDPIADKVPTTDNVGRMQQYTNMLRSMIKYGGEMGLNINAQFGATACYPGTPLESEFSKQHPDWRREDSLLLSVPEVREYMLSGYREVLSLGARGITIDFCRYPDGVDTANDCNTLMRDLRKLADEFGKARGKHVPIVIRFPSQGTRKWECFDYKTWAREGLVDYLCPSNIHGVYQFIDIKPYLAAVKGTKCKLTPEIDAIEWGPVMPGQLLWWTKHLYDAGADGVYIYQADGAINGREVRQCLSLLTSTEGIDRWLKRESERSPSYSKGIYITSPIDTHAYNYWERIRIWVDGVKPGKVETYLDGKPVGKLDSPPYLLGTDGFESNKVVPQGEHTLLIRAEDGDGWLEQTFSIKGGE